MFGQRLTAVAAVFSAALASACCIGPVLLAAIGAGGAGFAAGLAPYRPYLLAVAGVFLGAAFYTTYRRPATACGANGACSTQATRRPQKILLWSVTLSAVALGAFPYVAGLEARGGRPVAGPGHAEAAVTLDVQGMSCGSCALHVRQALAKVPGVADADVSYEESRARVTLSTPDVDPRVLVKAVEAAGYRAQVRESVAGGGAR
jgi:mercuric ion transport protein